MKVKFFSEQFTIVLEDYVNDFITKHKVTDIQYQFQSYRGVHSVMIVYEDTGDKKGE